MLRRDDSPTSWPQRLSQLVAFSPARQPYMVRRNYRHEIKSAFTFPLAMAMAEGAFAGVVAGKYFDASQLLLAVITAAPMFGNIVALFWGQVAEGRRKVPVINALQLGVALAVGAVGLTWFIPDTNGMPPAYAGWIFAGLIVLARVCASGIVTLRSAVWRSNYPTASRAQIVGRITVVNMATLAVLTTAGALLLDQMPASYAVMYPVFAAISAIGIYEFSRIRVRGEALHLREQPRIQRRGGVLRTYADQVSAGLALLREDRVFAKYQWFQFLLGVSFMFAAPSLYYMVSKEMTDPDRQYTLAVIVLSLIPVVASTLSIQFWAPLYDSMSLFRFRTIQSGIIVICQATILVGALTDQLWVVAVGMLLQGVCFGGGALAWQLGQHAFAGPDRIAQYMGVHVMLTGVRGCLAPFFGVGLYYLIGRPVFAVSLFFSAIGVAGYWWMSRKYVLPLEKV
ncbi:MAG: MFS transporter [Planctomycetota bacterium]